MEEVPDSISMQFSEESEPKFRTKAFGLGVALFWLRFSVPEHKRNSQAIAKLPKFVIAIIDRGRFWMVSDP